MNIKFICVDFQKEFSDIGGKWFNKGNSVNFIKEQFIPYLRNEKIRVSFLTNDTLIIYFG